VWTDHLDTPRLVTDAAGQVRWDWPNTDPFGNNAPNANPAGLGNFAFNLRFPGQYFDVETGLHYNYYRDYDPSIGRYVQSDPIGLRGGINTYGYVEAGPLRFSDPTGEAIPAVIAACASNPTCGMGIIAILGFGASQSLKKPANDEQFCSPPPPPDPCEQMRKNLDKQWTQFSWRQLGGADHGKLLNHRRSFNDAVEEFNEVCVPLGWAPFTNRFNIGPQSPAREGGQAMSAVVPNPICDR